MKSSTVILGVLSALILIVPGIGQSDSTVNLMTDYESVFADSMIASLNDVNPDAANNDNNVTANNVTDSDPEFMDVSTVDVSEIFSEIIFEEADVAEDVDVAEVEPVVVTPEIEDNVTAPEPDFLDVSTIDVSGIFSEFFFEEADAAEEVDVAELEAAPVVDDETFPELVDRGFQLTSSMAAFLEIPYVVERPYTKGQMMS